MAVHGIIGRKVGMTQVFDADGNLVPVTVIDASTCTVIGKRTPERDQYSALPPALRAGLSGQPTHTHNLLGLQLQLVGDQLHHKEAFS